MIASSKLSDFITLAVNDNHVKKLFNGGLALPLNKLAEQYQKQMGQTRFFYRRSNYGDRSPQ
ncbi:hypothetical protein GCM10008018_73010 [Paenibacillus marchantiophytorum]|uniref:Uncharacterized protein n=2 Tax=Paenibacillus marchantiophytorum TaxID=1619310 RepID=A0ABQ1FKV7_9BACL|nr:hypothetical protein GCM10008018_73010 [Paenibacillus marchantiophytorum]